MRRLLVLLALLGAACAPTRLPQPTGRAEACARIAQPGVDLGIWEFCEPGGAATCGLNRTVQMTCRVKLVGAQTVCDIPPAPREDPNVPQRTCLVGNAGADCPAWWRCEQLPATATYPAGNYCVPGPPCSAGADAGARD